MASDDLRLPIGIPVETDAAKAADSIQGLKDSLVASKDAIAATAAAMRDLRGNSDAVKAAKDQLRAKLEAEKAAVSNATLALAKHGTSLGELAKKERAAADKAKGVADAAKDFAANEKKKTEAARKAKEDLNKLDDQKFDMLITGATMAATAVLAIGAGAVSAAVSMSKFIMVSADALRMMQLTRKANLRGNDSWATNLGEQVDALARKVPLAKDRLNELGITLAKSRIGGQTMVDTMNAVGGATAAAGDDLGNKLKGIVERGAFTRRFQLSPQELMGMDLDFNDVAKAYAEGMNVSVNRAREELVSGRVRLADGAKALRKAVEKNFGDINADKLLSLDNQANKFKEDLVALASGVDMKPILEGIRKIAFNFDQASVNGKAMKNIVTTIGKSIGIAFADGVPSLQDFVDKAVWGALKLENYWLRAKIAFTEAFGKKTTLEAVTFKGVLGGIVGALIAITPGMSALAGLYHSFKLVNISLDAVEGAIGRLKAAILSSDWVATGASMIDGLIDGLGGGAKRLLDKVKGLGGDIKKTFADVLEIHSPSRVFKEYGQNTTAGYVAGVDEGSPRVNAAVAAMAPVPGASGGASGGSRGSVQITITPTIVVQGGGGESIQQQLANPSLLRELTEHILSGCRAAGIEVAA